MTYPSRTPIDFWEPYRFTISDQYGQSITLSEAPNLGDVLSIEVSDRNEDGEAGVMSIDGFFHGLSRQNSFSTVQRLSSMKRLSEQEDQHLILLCPHPEVEMRGYIENLDGPNWSSSPANKFFSFSFDFRRDPFDRQPNRFRPITEIIPSEGKPYVFATVTADYTNLRDFMYAYFGRRKTDGQMIQRVLQLNLQGPDWARAMPVGSRIKVPLNP